jgi:hypothetical protein
MVEPRENAYMRKALLFAIFLQLSVAADPSSLRFDWDRDGVPEEFRLGGVTQHDARTAATTLTVSSLGKEVLVASITDDAFVPYLDVIPKAARVRNLARSKWLLFLPQQASDRGLPVIFAFGGGYECCLPPMHAYIWAGPRPSLAFSEPEFRFLDFADHNGDGYRDIVGFRCLAQTGDRKSYTYNPLLVFAFSPSNSRYVLSPTHSKRLNLLHGGRWLGPECTDQLIKSWVWRQKDSFSSLR